MSSNPQYHLLTKKGSEPKITQEPKGCHDPIRPTRFGGRARRCMCRKFAASVGRATNGESDDEFPGRGFQTLSALRNVISISNLQAVFCGPIRTPTTHSLYHVLKNRKDTATGDTNDFALHQQLSAFENIRIQKAFHTFPSD